MECREDYKQLLTAYRQLEKENRKLKKMLSTEDVSRLENLVKDCIRYNRDQLRKVAIEIQLTKYDNRNIEKIMTLTTFFKTMCDELNMMTEAGG